MGTITRTLANNITTGGIILPSGINNTSISNVTSLPAGVGGDVLQVIQTADSVQASSTTGLNKLSTNITPSATSSKVLIMVQANFYATTDHALGYLRKNSSVLWEGTGGTKSITVGGHLDNNNYGGNSNTPMGTSFVCYLDSPNTTSSVNYDFRIIDDSNGVQTVYWNMSSSGKFSKTSSMTLMEIGA